MVISSIDRNLLSEECVEKLRSLLPPELMDDERTRQWWDCVFFRQDGGFVYDKEYDNFRISENSDKTFGQLLSEIVMLHLSTGIKLHQKGDKQEEVLVPLVDETLNSIALDDKTWRDVIPDENADFYINGIGMKRIMI